MTEQTEFAIEEKKPTRWRRFSTWLINLEEAMNYDSQAHANVTISYLIEGMTRLESRVNKLERTS